MSYQKAGIMHQLLFVEILIALRRLSLRASNLCSILASNLILCSFSTFSSFELQFFNDVLTNLFCLFRACCTTSSQNNRYLSCFDLDRDQSFSHVQKRGMGLGFSYIVCLFIQFIIFSQVFYVILLVLQLNLSGVDRDKVSGQASAEIHGTRPYFCNNQLVSKFMNSFQIMQS